MRASLSPRNKQFLLYCAIFTFTLPCISDVWKAHFPKESVGSTTYHHWHLFQMCNVRSWADIIADKLLPASLKLSPNAAEWTFSPCSKVFQAMTACHVFSGTAWRKKILLLVLTLQVWRTAGPRLPVLAATSNARQLASEHSIGGPSASWEIQMGLCLLKLLVSCLLFQPTLKKPPSFPGI